MHKQSTLMKKIYIPFLLAIAAIFPSCNQDRLDIEQKGVTAIETFYQTDADCEAALVAAYANFANKVCSQNGGSIYVPFRAAYNLCGDDMYAAGEFFGDNDFMAALNEFRYDSSSAVLTNAYKNIFLAMYPINLVIDKFKDGLPEGGQTATTKRCVAEARVLRAYLHMMLAIGWGNPPFVDHVLTGDALPYNCDTDPENPMTHDELLLWCAKECEAALPDLDERKSTADKEGVAKVTKGFANAVAGKAYLFAGNYAAAKSALNAVITSNKYALVPGEEFMDQFHIEGDCSAEKIFESNIQDNAAIGTWGGKIQRSTWMEANIWNWRSDHFVANPSSNYSSIDGWGGCGVPQSFADEFLANDGPDSYRFNATMIHIDKVVYETEYGLDVDKLSLEEKKASKDLGIDGRGLYGQSFYLPLKPICRIADLLNRGNNVRMNNYTIMRYAEVLLMYAEACVQTGDAASALKVVNDIQKRAGSKTISTSVDMGVIEKEKKYELWLEGCRWADMVRWGHLDGAKQAGQAVPILYDKLTRAPKADDQGLAWENGSEANSRFYTVITHEAKDKGYDIGYKDKNKYFPFPYSATSINPNLTQHEGF